MPDVPPSSSPLAPPPPSREHVIGHGVSWLASWTWRWLLIAAAAALLAVLVGLFWSILLPVLLALVLVAAIHPISDWLHARLRFPRAAAAGATVVLFLAVVVGGLAAIAPSFANQTSNIVSSASGGIQQLQDYVQKVKFLTADQVDEALQTLQDKVQGSSSQIIAGVLNGVGVAGSIVITFVVTLVLTFLFLKDGHKFQPWLTRTLGDDVGGHLATVSSRGWLVLGGFIRTQALVSLIDAVFIGAGLLIVGVPLAIPLAVLTFAGGFIPIVGAFVAGALAVLVALVSNGVTGALIILAVVVAVQQLEGNVLSPWLQAKSMNLHPAIVLLSVTLFGTLFGIIGAFLAVPAAAVTAVVIRYLGEVVDERSAPVDDHAEESVSAEDSETEGAETEKDTADD